MLLVDTMVVRSGAARQLAQRRCEADGPIGVPAVVVQELLQHLGTKKNDEVVRGSLRLISGPAFRVLPEESGRIRSAFGMSTRLSPTNGKEWKRLAALAGRDATSDLVFRTWDGLVDDGRVETSRAALSSGKTSKDFKNDLRELLREVGATARRAIDKGPASGGVRLRGSERDYVLRLQHLYLSVHTGLLRAWLLNQLAAAAGVDGVEDRLKSKPEGDDPFRLYNELVKPAYQGGLELLVRLFEAAWLPWMMEESKAPETNDFYDAMIFASVPEPEGILVTHESKWLAAAGACGLEHRVVHSGGLLREPPSVPGPSESPDWNAVSADRRLIPVRPAPALSPSAIRKWIAAAKVDASQAYGSEDLGAWWPRRGIGGQGQTTTWSWATVARVAAELPEITYGPLSLSCNWGTKRHRGARAAVLEELWLSNGWRHSKYEIRVDFLVSDYQRVGSPLLLACESEAHPYHGAGPGMGGQSKRHPERIDDYTWDLYKLLLTPAPYRLFIARIGPYRERLQSERIDELRGSVVKVVEDYGSGLLGSAELAVVIIPMDREPSDSVLVGAWNQGDWDWERVPLAIRSR